MADARHMRLMREADKSGFSHFPAAVQARL
jgi:hypothetical protein